VQQLRKALADKLAEFARTHADVLRDGSHVERDGRYGLPLRADAHRKLDGIVLGSSSTGATLYVEPPAVTALSNKLRLAEDDVEREEARVLAELSHALGEMLDAFARAYEVCLEADLLAALSRWAQSARARCVAPDDGDDVVLRHMRHPLLVLQGAPVVANDITLSTKSALVISGPNAGGKTVALKCLGLAVWMSRSGIPIPLGEDSRIGWFGRVLTGIGDEQSIARSLSTFSAHVTNLARILRAADGRTLVLLDEIAGGTDPEEGAALAAAVLEALIERGSAVATTTHYERLKELAAQDPRFVNASVGFDFEAMLPTFELRLGIPGASSALMVAARFDMPADVVQRARAFMSEPSLAREELLARIQRDQSALHEARQAAENDARAVAELRAELESQRSIVRDKERKKLERERDTMMSEVRGARAELRALMAGARDGSDLKRAERAIDEAAKVVSVGAPIDLATRNSPVAAPVDDDAKLAKGTLVWVERLNSTAEVVDPPERGEVRVRAGAFTMRVPVSELRLATQKKRPAAQPTYHHTPTPVARAAALRTSTNTCDLRGRRVDDALTELDRFVDDLSRGAPDDAGFVLHGHGTGALKQAVRDHLAASGRIAEMRPAEQGEGGDAFTVFWLRG
jgi:DNA mismatch repair protein MutS2